MFSPLNPVPLQLNTSCRVIFQCGATQFELCPDIRDLEAARLFFRGQREILVQSHDESTDLLERYHLVHR